MLNCNLMRSDGVDFEIVGSGRFLSVQAQSDDEALCRFGEKLGVTLTFDGDGLSLPDYLFGSQQVSDDPLKAATWAKATVPVFVKRAAT